MRAIKLILSLFYDETIFSSKWFNKNHIGYLWAIMSIPHRLTRRDIKVPYSHKATIFSGKNLGVAPSSINCLQTDIYLQNRLNRVDIGEDCYIASHVGIITEQHDVYNPDQHIQGKNVKIGDACWIGMNAVIMPGVVLGNHTTVGANSVVTRSFPEGHVVVAGAPAKVIRRLDPQKY